MTSITTSPADACLVRGYCTQPAVDGVSGVKSDIVIEQDSLDGVLRWVNLFPDGASEITYWRMYCVVGDLLNCLRGLQQIEGGRVTVQYTGKHLIITAPTPERLIEQFNREVR